VTFPLAFVVGVSVASIPGPTIILIATQTLRHGPRAGLTTMLAPVLLDAFLMLPLGLALQASVFTGQGAVVLAFCGAAFLLWLGAQSIRAGMQHAKMMGASEAALADGKQEINPFVKGLLTHVGSPYPYLYWATVGASFIRQGFASGGIFGAALFPLGFWLGACSFTVVVIYLVARTKQLLPPRVEPYLHHVSGVLLIGGGIYLAVSSWRGAF
jgi:threonine/homoserine/homoserine lactone efflux protein